jgi:hypothetical protein
MSMDLTPRTRQVTAHFFHPSTASFVEGLLVEECGSNLPLYKPSTPEGLERVQLAALKISNGDEDELLEALSLVKRDWRDVLVWAGFGNDLEAHNKWAEELR